MKTIRIIATSDIHGHIFPTDLISGRTAPSSLAQAYAFVRRQRQQRGDGIVLLDNGDVLQGHPTFNALDDGVAAAADIMNFMGYDCATIGNHDIETGRTAWQRWRDRLECPLLGANVGLSPYSIVCRGDIRIAVIGIVTTAMGCWLSPPLLRGMPLDEPVECVRHWVEHIRANEHANLIVGLFHTGIVGGIRTPWCAENAAIDIAREVSGLDIVICGHDHIGQKQVVKAPDGSATIVLNPGSDARNVAVVDIVTDDMGHRHIEGRIQNVDNELPDDLFMQKFGAMAECASRNLCQPIGRLTAPLLTRDCYFGPSPLASLMHRVQLEATGADVSLYAPVTYDNGLPSGVVTRGHLFGLYPYANTICALRMTGEELRQYLEYVYDQWIVTMTDPASPIMRLTADGGSFQQLAFNFESAAGIDYEVDVTQPAGSRIRILQLSNGRRFDNHAHYTVAMHSYRANGGNLLLKLGAGIDHADLHDRLVYETTQNQRQCLRQHFERHGTVCATTLCNWQFIPTVWTAPAIERTRERLFPDK